MISAGNRQPPLPYRPALSRWCFSELATRPLLPRESCEPLLSYICNTLAVMMEPGRLDKLLAEETEASERTRDEPLSDQATRKRDTQSVVYSIRLTPGQIEEIQRLAAETGVLATALVRGWVLHGLAAERENSVEQTVEALSMNVARLRQQLAESQAS
jgi:hypothetical protein